MLDGLQFKKIEGVENMAAGQMLDVVGIVESAGEHQTITLKSGRDAEKRTLCLQQACQPFTLILHTHV